MRFLTRMPAYFAQFLALVAAKTCSRSAVFASLQLVYVSQFTVPEQSSKQVLSSQGPPSTQQPHLQSPESAPSLGLCQRRSSTGFSGNFDYTQALQPVLGSSAHI